jgi:uncharacterized protein
VAQVLIDAGTNVNAGDDLSLTPLMYAAFCGRTKIVNLLLIASAETDLLMNCGTSALRIAVMKGNLEVVKYLLESSANCEQSSNPEENPLSIAVSNSGAKIARLLLQARAQIEILLENRSLLCVQQVEVTKSW